MITVFMMGNGIVNAFLCLDSHRNVEQNLREGFGEELALDATYYIGNWRNDMYSHKGRIIYPSGDAYQGDWKDGVKHGEGQYYFADGSVFKGTFQNDQQHGYGIFYPFSQLVCRC